MIRLTADHPRPRTPSGFAWWYIDTVDADGNGVVLVWAPALPFLPRAGGPGCEAAMNVAVYEGGRQVFYVLEQVAPEQVDVDGDVVRVGRSWFRSACVNGERVVTGWIDCPIPGATDRLRGTVRLRGPALAPPTWGDAASTHDWMPLCAPAIATVRLRGAGFRYSATSRGYHDRNGADVPMHTLGIRWWAWGRLAFPDHELLYYHLVPEAPGGSPTALVLRCADGRVDLLPGAAASPRRPRRDRYGLPWAGEWAITAPGYEPVVVQVAPPVDAGPFYLRHPIASGDARGWGESCWPAAVDRPLLRPFVRMRVAGPHHSVWSPLFLGPSTGRLGRLARWWRTP